MEGLMVLEGQMLKLVEVAVQQKERMDDLHSMISAISPGLEVKKEDYERLVARSTKEAESLKKASDSLPTKRAKKEEA